jgi:hypothetical protein
MKNLNLFLLAALTIFSFASCEKVIELDLKNTEPRLVVSGSVSDQTGPYAFNITETIDYNQPNDFPLISGATITLSDNNGTSETLTEQSPGLYWANTITGVAGRTYSMKINYENKEYNSTITMAQPISIDSVNIEAFTTFSGEELPLLTTYFQDPPNEKNYYYLNYQINGEDSGDFSFLSDDLRDGEEIVVGTISEDYEGVAIGDTITVQLQSIDASMYEYYRTREALENGGGSGLGSSTPDNPVSNITGGALGYFKVYSQTEKDYIIQ